MPANKKHLTNPIQRLAKISAGFIGGYLVTMSFFFMISLWLDRAATMVTMVYGGFILWTALLVGAFLFKNGWLAWGLYLVLTLVFASLFYWSSAH